MMRFLSGADGDSGCCHLGLGLGDGVLAVVEDAGSQDRVGVALGHTFNQVVEGFPLPRWL